MRIVRQLFLCGALSASSASAFAQAVPQATPPSPQQVPPLEQLQSRIAYDEELLKVTKADLAAATEAAENQKVMVNILSSQNQQMQQQKQALDAWWKAEDVPALEESKRELDELKAKKSKDK